MNGAVNRCAGSFDPARPSPSRTPTPPVGECVDTIGWTNGAGHSCEVYRQDWCRDNVFQGVGYFHNYPGRNCCECGKGSAGDDLVSGAIAASSASLVPLVAFVLIWPFLH